MIITGTFLDEITHDIPSQNQGPDEWARDFDAMKSSDIDTVILIHAMDYDELPDFLQANSTLARKHGITCWGNVECFDRDMPIKFPPIPYNRMRYKMEQAASAGFDKLITFEFSHFMSPNSTWESARNLH